MKRMFPTFRKMTSDETSSYNLQNPALILEYCNLMIPLSAGYSDRHRHNLPERQEPTDSDYQQATWVNKMAILS